MRTILSILRVSHLHWSVISKSVKSKAWKTNDVLCEQPPKHYLALMFVRKILIYISKLRFFW